MENKKKNDAPFNEKKIDGRTVFYGDVFDVSLDTVKINNGATVLREVVHHTGGAAVLAVNDSDEIALVRQFRYGAGHEMVELPAGKVERGEDPRATAIRELEEEAGYQADEFNDFGKIHPTSAYNTEIIHLYVAKKLRFVGQHLDKNELLEVHWMPLHQVVDLIMQGEITDGKTVSAVLKYFIKHTK